MTEISCGGVAGGGGGSPPPSITVTVGSGAPSSVHPNNQGGPSQTAQFTATVANSSNTAVTWTQTTANRGTIDNVAGRRDATGTNHETLEATTLPETDAGITVTATEASGVHANSVTLLVQWRLDNEGRAVLVAKICNENRPVKSSPAT
jgi:hypothetical protein